MDLGKCLVMLATVKAGQVAKWPLRMALIQVEVDGLKQAACRNCMSSGRVEDCVVL